MAFYLGIASWINKVKDLKKKKKVETNVVNVWG